MNLNQVIPPGKRGRPSALPVDQELDFVSEFIEPNSNRSEVCRTYGVHPANGMRTAKRILRENPHFLKLSGASEETPYATNHEGQPHNQSDYTSPDAEGISGLQQAA
jgi:hypothetical protein